MTVLYIQNKSPETVVELMDVDGVRILATLEPGKFVEVKSPPGKTLRPFVFREKKKE